jgi:hypothetical protein
MVFETIYDLAHFWGDIKVIEERKIFLVLEILKVWVQKCVGSKNQSNDGFRYC